MDLNQIALETMERMWDLHQTMYRILEKNIEKARIEIGDLNPDPWFFSHFVRFHTCIDIDAIPQSSLTLQRAKHPMSGIEILYRSTKIKVWKANGGELPIPGQSGPRRSFLFQPIITGFTEPELVSAKTIFNPPFKLALLWDIDSNFNMSQMNLVCPRDFDNPWKSPDSHFIRAIPHPATGIVIEPKFTEVQADLEIELERKKVDSGYDD